MTDVTVLHTAQFTVHIESCYTDKLTASGEVHFVQLYELNT